MTYYSRVIKIPFQEVVTKMINNLQQQGFEIITSVDLQDTFKQKLNMGFRNYRILSTYNPQFAYKAVSLESHMGVMVPCNIVIQEHENGDVEVTTINPIENIDKTLDTTQLMNITSDVGNLLRQAIDDLIVDHTEDACQALPGDQGRQGCTFALLG